MDLMILNVHKQVRVKQMQLLGGLSCQNISWVSKVVQVWETAIFMNSDGRLIRGILIRRMRKMTGDFLGILIT